MNFIITRSDNARSLRASYRGPIKFYMSISNRLIIIISGDNHNSISFLYRNIFMIFLANFTITKSKKLKKITIRKVKITNDECAPALL